MNRPARLAQGLKARASAKAIPARLCLEITETVLVADAKKIIEKMRDITWLGPSWALDDFGTGYSSLAYLSGMPLSKVKLDRAFVIGLGEDPASLAIGRSVRQICDRMGLSLLCEGVETNRQAAILARERCDLVQGYLFGRPLPIDAIVDLSRQGALGRSRQP